MALPVISQADRLVHWSRIHDKSLTGFETADSAKYILYSCISIDRARGDGFFREHQATFGDSTRQFIWPKACVDHYDRVQMVAVAYEEFGSSSRPFVYLTTTDYGVTWSEPIEVDSVMSISPIICVSPVSNKISIVYIKSIDGFDISNGEVVVITSYDGVTWDFSRREIITPWAAGDSVRAYSDVDACYDWNDSLHIVFPAHHWVGGMVGTAANLMHWSRATGLTIVASGWYDSSPGSWNRTISKPSVGINPRDNSVYACWTQFMLGDISRRGYSNGDILISGSLDGGATWLPTMNLTNSPSPSCSTGTCNSDHWSSLAELVNDTMHIQYINDKDAGGFPQGEGDSTYNPVLYMKVPLENLILGDRPLWWGPSPGDTVGMTWYDYQHNGSMGKMIVMDHDARPHMCYMNGLDRAAIDRHVYYNYFNPDHGWIMPRTGLRVEELSRSGYCNAAVYSDNRVVPIYHTTMIFVDSTGPASNMESPTPESWVACADQAVTLRLFDRRGVNPTTIHVLVQGVEYTEGDGNLFYYDTYLIFSPSTNWVDGETVTIELIHAEDSLGNNIPEPVTWHFYVDLTPPVIAPVLPPAGTTTVACDDYAFRWTVTDAHTPVNRLCAVMVGTDTLREGDARRSWSGDTLILQLAGFVPTGDTATISIAFPFTDIPGSCNPNRSHDTWSAVFDPLPPAYAGQVPSEGSLLSSVDTIGLVVTDLVGVDPASVTLTVLGRDFTLGTSLHREGDFYYLLNAEVDLPFPRGDSVVVSVRADDIVSFCRPNHSETAWNFFVANISFVLPDTAASPGDTILIPLLPTEALIAGGVNAVEFTFYVDPAIAVPFDVVLTGCLTETWTPTTVIPGPGSLRVVLMGTDGLNGDLPLVYIKVAVPVTARLARFARMTIPDLLLAGRAASRVQPGVLWIRFAATSWTVDLTMYEVGGYNRDRVVTFGAAPTGSDLFNPGLDWISLPAITELPAYFSLTDPAYPVIDRLSRDIRWDAAESLRWVLHTGSERAVHLAWNPDLLPPGTLTIDNVVDMLITGEYTVTDRDSVVIRYLRPQMRSAAIRLIPGWNLVSFPVLPAFRISISDLLSVPPSQIYSYAPGSGYAHADYARAGEAYWVLTDETVDLPLAGQPVNSYDRALPSGWNLLGCVVDSVGAANLTATPPAGIDPLQMYRWSAGAYVRTTDFLPGEGRWILVYRPVGMTLTR